MRRRGHTLAAGLVLLGLVAAGCGSGSSDDATPAPRVAGNAADTGTTAYDAALSEPREDSVYPDVGDPGVDALHYALDLSWDDRSVRLTAKETVLFRASRAADHLQLDLARQLSVGHVWLDGKAVSFQHSDEEPGRLPPPWRPARGTSSSSATPAPPSRSRRRPTAPTSPPPAGQSRGTARCGRCRSRSVPTRWYAVNDQPSDKAFYDVTIHAPKGQVGVFNGELRSRTTSGDETAHPMAPARAGRVVPDHDRDRAVHGNEGHRTARPADELLDTDG